MTVPRRSRHLLLVEDSDDLRESLALLLELEGHKVRTAACGEAALRLCGEELPEVALIDLGLPDIDGCDLARRLRELPNSGRFELVALTGSAGCEVEERCYKAGFDAHLLKPIDIETLQRLLA